MKAFLAYISMFATSMWPFEKCEIRDAKISFHIKRPWKVYKYFLPKQTFQYNWLHITFFSSTDWI